MRALVKTTSAVTNPKPREQAKCLQFFLDGFEGLHP